MYNVYFYRDRNGREPLKEYLLALQQRQDKDSRINLNKINDYIQMLSEYGIQAGEPYLKHIEGNIWELRPVRNRIFFVCWVNNSYVLLHHFVKKTPKTPAREIEQAKRELADLIERSGGYGR